MTTVISAYSSKPVHFELIKVGYEEGGIFEAINPKIPTPVPSEQGSQKEIAIPDENILNKEPTSTKNIEVNPTIVIEVPIKESKMQEETVI